MKSNTLGVTASDQPYTLIVEPWAEEFTISIGDQCRIVAFNPEVIPTFAVEVGRTQLVVWVNEGGSTYEFWRGEQCEFSTPVPIPGSPHSF